MILERTNLFGYGGTDLNSVTCHQKLHQSNLPSHC